MTLIHAWRIIEGAGHLRTAAASEETVPLLASLGRISSRNVRAQVSLPPFDVSALDGYALKGAGTRFRLQGLLEPFSGDAPVMKEGEALFVPTGGCIPRRTRFVRRESVTESEDSLSVASGGDERRLWRRGYWMKKGKRIVPRGEVIGSGTIESLALARLTEVHVFRRPSVAIVTTGDELKKGKVPDSNSYLLASLAARDGAGSSRIATAGDSEEEIRQKVGSFESADLLLITGGTSKGRRDLTYGALEAMGAHFLLRQPPFIPGKTMAFGITGKSLFFILPGNPRALRALYELFVRPSLLMLSGRQGRGRESGTFILGREIEKERGKTLFIPVKISFEKGTVEELYAERPDGFAVIERQAAKVPAGEEVRVVWREREYL